MTILENIIKKIKTNWTWGINGISSYPCSKLTTFKHHNILYILPKYFLILFLGGGDVILLHKNMTLCPKYFVQSCHVMKLWQCTIVTYFKKQIVSVLIP